MATCTARGELDRLPIGRLSYLYSPAWLAVGPLTTTSGQIGISCGVCRRLKITTIRPVSSFQVGGNLWSPGAFN